MGEIFHLPKNIINALHFFVSKTSFILLSKQCAASEQFEAVTKMRQFGQNVYIPFSCKPTGEAQEAAALPLMSQKY